MLGDELDLAGYDVRFPGADVPSESSLPPLIRTEEPDLLSVLVTMLNLQFLRDTVCAAQPGVELVAKDAREVGA